MHAHIRVPPDSTGKRIHGRSFIDLEYTGLNTTLYKDDILTFQQSGIIAYMSKQDSYDATSGEMHVLLTAGSAETDAIPGEAILRNNVQVATVVGISTKFFDTSAIITGRDVDSWMRVDEYGAAHQRFTDGSPTVEGTNKLRTAQAWPIGSYEFSNGPKSHLFWDYTTGGGSITHSTQSSCMLMSVDNMPGSMVKRVTHRYHYFVPGSSNMCYMSLSHGDAGKANNTRMWGFGDDNDGMGFMLVGTDLRIVIRTSVSGTPVDSVINRVDWNGDKVDGTGLSKHNLDITHRNLYWIEYVWPAGALRFGIFTPMGKRVVCHTCNGQGSPSLPWSRISAFPVFVAQYNTDTTASSSEMRFMASSVYTEGKPDYTYMRYADMQNSTLKSIGVKTPLLSVRPALTYHGVTNRVGVYGEHIDVYVTDGPIKIELYGNIPMGVYTAATWAYGGTSSIQGDDGATAVDLTGMVPTRTFYLDPGCHTIEIFKYLETNGVGICLHADGVTQLAVAFVATKLSTTANAMMTLGYRELI